MLRLNLLLILSPSRFAVCGHHLSPRMMAIVVSLLINSVPNFSMSHSNFVYFPRLLTHPVPSCGFFFRECFVFMSDQCWSSCCTLPDGKQIDIQGCIHTSTLPQIRDRRGLPALREYRASWNNYRYPVLQPGKTDTTYGFHQGTSVYSPPLGLYLAHLYAWYKSYVLYVSYQV